MPGGPEGEGGAVVMITSADELLARRDAQVEDRDVGAFADTGPTGDPEVDLVRAGTRRAIAAQLEQDAMRDVERALVAADAARPQPGVQRLATLGGVSRPTVYASIPSREH